MRRSVLSLALGALILASTAIIAGQPAGATTQSAGDTTFRLSVATSKALFFAGVTVYAAAPATGSVDEDGRLQLRLPVRPAKDPGKASPLAGGLLFTRLDTGGGVILEGIVLDSRVATARVSSTAGPWGKTVPVFRLAQRRYVPSERVYTYTLKLTAAAARLLNAGMDVSVFSPGMPLGRGTTAR